MNTLPQRLIAPRCHSVGTGIDRQCLKCDWRCFLFDWREFSWCRFDLLLLRFHFDLLLLRFGFRCWCWFGFRCWCWCWCCFSVAVAVVVVVSVVVVVVVVVVEDVVVFKTLQSFPLHPAIHLHEYALTPS